MHSALRGRLTRMLALATTGLMLPAVAQDQPAHAAGHLEAIPPALQPAILQALARDAGHAYDLDAEGCATVSREALAGCFDAGGARFAGAGAGALSLRLAAVGREDRLVRVATPAPRVDGNRVEYRHDGLTEWWNVLPVGFEQGFTFDERPTGAGTLMLAMEASRGGSPLGGGAAWGSLRYGALVVTDAQGLVVPATMTVSGRQLLIAVQDAAAVYPLTVDPLVWVEQKVTASDGGGQFGWSVAIDGSTAVVGATLAMVGSNDRQGTAYVFTESGGVWTESQVLTASDGAAQDFFGFSVAIDGGTIVVGALYTAGNRGGAYVFTESGGTWTQQAKLTASDGTSGAEFGISAALEGNTAVVGAQYGAGNAGAAYVYNRSGTVWSEVAILTASDGASGDQFGGSLDLSGSNIVVGAESAAVGDSVGQGAAYVFNNPGTGWTQVQKLVASDGTGGDGFGTSVAIRGTTAIVGAYFATVNGQDFRGAAYVFTAAGPTWTESQKLIASNGSNNDYFGVGVALSDTTAFVGALYGADDYQGGVAYVFYRTGATWTEGVRIMPLDGHQDDAFGQVLAVDDDRALVGAYPGAGAAYFFMATDPPQAAVSPTTISVSVETGSSTTTTFQVMNQAAPDAADLMFEISVAAAPPGVSRTVAAPARAAALAPGETGLDRYGASSTRDYVEYTGAPRAIWAGEEVTLTQSVSQTIVTGAGIACNTKGQGTAENSYWRVFDLVEYDLAALDVTSVDVAIEIASVTGSHTATIRLYRLDGAFVTSNLTLVAESTFPLTSGSAQIVNVPIAGAFDDQDLLVVEWFVPDLRPTSGTLFPGANSAGETGPGYISSFSCKILEPTPLASIGFPESHMVMNVHGLGTPALVAAAPRSGTVPPGASEPITLTINAISTEPGVYPYEARVSTNDPDLPLLVVDVNVTVGAVGTEDGTPPAAFSLTRIEPNPVVSTTRIAYALPVASSVRVAVYDAMGRLVATLVDGERPAGRHAVEWDAREVSAGVYFCRMEAGDFGGSMPMVVTR